MEARDETSLAPFQRSFIANFVTSRAKRSLLVASPGKGKTTTALAAGDHLLKSGAIDALAVVSSFQALREQWRRAAGQLGIHLGWGLDAPDANQGLVGTAEDLQRQLLAWRAGGRRDLSRWMFVVEEQDDWTGAISVIDGLVGQNPASRSLFLASDLPQSVAFDQEFRFTAEFVLGEDRSNSPQTHSQLLRYSPALLLVPKIAPELLSLDGLTWREFEVLVSQLLEADGYSVELMRGTKDGGVDVVATKDLGPHGFFKSVWQAKKLGAGRKVGLPMIRELADTRQEFGASKGIIITTSHLTRGAIDRVERDKYLLGKVDRDDLKAWIDRILKL